MVANVLVRRGVQAVTGGEEQEGRGCLPAPGKLRRNRDLETRIQMVI